MAEFVADNEIVTQFLLNTCKLDKTLNNDRLIALFTVARVAGLMENRVVTGSIAEFYIQPMLSCVGDFDVMHHFSNELAIPSGTAPPTDLPGEFDSRVEVYEIVDSEFPAYVYLASAYVLTECTDVGKYNAVECERFYCECKGEYHGPAVVDKWENPGPLVFGRVTGSIHSADSVYCMRCLSWLPQAADWPTRHRSYGWPDSATLGRVVSKGCDVVRKAHRLCRQDHKNKQFRLSFSRAEIVLINTWTPVQQVIYHMLRVFVKMEQLTDSVTDSDAATLSSYHIKTLMLWTCELKPTSWWTDDLNLVRLSVELLHSLAVWLRVTDARCPHYFISSCNLFDPAEYWLCSPLLIASRLISVTEVSLVEWFINNYICRCAELYTCPASVSRLFDDVNSKVKLQHAVLAVVDHRSVLSQVMAATEIASAGDIIIDAVSRNLLTLCSCLFLMRELAKTDQRLCVYFTAVTFLHVACKTDKCELTDELLDVLLTSCVQSNDVHVRRCRNARHNSVLSLSQAAKLMKIVANNSRSTVQLIEIELSKAYLYRALRLRDSDSDCLTNIYLAVLYYTTGQYQTAIDHCTLVTRAQGNSQCSSHVVEGELLPKIDDEIDTVLGLAVFHQYLRTAALNKQQTQHVSVFTTKLFAHYLHIRCLSITTSDCGQLTLTSLTDEMRRCHKFFYELQDMFQTDLLFFIFLSRAKYPTNKRDVVVSSRTKPVISSLLDTSELVELLQQSAVEHLTAFRQLEEPEFSSVGFPFVTTDFEALYAYKRGDYRHCLQLSTDNVRTLIGSKGVSRVCTYPDFIQLMDDDLVSLIGLVVIDDPSCRNNVSDGKVQIHQLYLSLYLMAQCQLKLHHSVTSLEQTLDYVKVARHYLDDCFTLDQLLVKLTEHKLLCYVSGQ